MRLTTIKNVPSGQYLLTLVTKEYGDGDCWSKTLVVPRGFIIREIRRAKAKGLSARSALDVSNWWHLPDGLLTVYHYGGPGCSFAHPATLAGRGLKRYRLVYQRGGYDV